MNVLKGDLKVCLKLEACKVENLNISWFENSRILEARKVANLKVSWFQIWISERCLENSNVFWINVPKLRDTKIRGFLEFEITKIQKFDNLKVRTLRGWKPAELEVWKYSVWTRNWRVWKLNDLEINKSRSQKPANWKI